MLVVDVVHSCGWVGFWLLPCLGSLHGASGTMKSRRIIFESGFLLSHFCGLWRLISVYQLVEEVHSLTTPSCCSIYHHFLMNIHTSTFSLLPWKIPDKNSFIEEGCFIFHSLEEYNHHDVRKT